MRLADKAWFLFFSGKNFWQSAELKLLSGFKQIMELVCPLKIVILFFVLVEGMPMQAQTLTLEKCYNLSSQNYPLVKQRELIRKSGDYSVDNVSKGFLPQVSVNGQLSYQSEVISIPVSIPGIEIPPINKDQYKVYGEVVQPITDLLLVNQQRHLQQAANQLQDQSLEVQLYMLRERINQLFFGVLLVDEQIIQNDLMKKDIESGISRISNAMKNGIEFKTGLDKFQVELLKIKQKESELRSIKKAYSGMLAMFINEHISDSAHFERPAEIIVESGINRPELLAFDLEKRSFDVQSRMIRIRNYPKLFLFFQGGWGRPSPLNLLSNELKEYYFTGIRMNWSLSTFYTSTKERKIMQLNQLQADVKKETFLFNTNFDLTRQNAEVLRLTELRNLDKEIIMKQHSIKNAAAVQLQNGMIAPNEYLNEVNAEGLARQTSSLHQVQLLMAMYNQKTTSGN